MAEVIFVGTTREDQSANTVVEVKFVSTTRKDQSTPHTIPLDTLLGSYGLVYTALKNDKEMGSTEYLGCNIETFKQHIEQQFTESMSWENYSEWHIDHKIPLKYNKPSLEEVVQRLH